MKKIIQTKPIATQQNIHVQDQATLVDFLDTNSRAIGAIENFGTFIDIRNVTNDIGIKVTNKFLIVEREEGKAELAGDELGAEAGAKKKDIFEYPYTLPDVFPDVQTEKEVCVIPTTIKTHPCNPEKTCDMCSGSGKCAACEGRGKISCRSCRGTGKKEIRDGNRVDGKPKYKKIDCPTCDGFKRIICSACNGTKACEMCNGSGKVICDRCGGAAIYQTFCFYATLYKSTSSEKYYTSIQEIAHVIQSTKNQVKFDDELVEWEASNAVLFDKRNDAIKENKHFSEFASCLDVEAGLTENQKLGRVHTTFENVPITIIGYTFEDKEYTLYIVGENNIVWYREIPKKHIYKANIITRIINLFTKKKRNLAFIYIASYIFHSDGTMDEQEEQLMALLMDHINLSQAERQQLVSGFGSEISFEQIVPYLKSTKNDLRAVVFAWQCVLQDKAIEKSEIAAFNVLADFFGVDASSLEGLKRKAEKFGKLKNTQLLKEYFK